MKQHPKEKERIRKELERVTKQYESLHAKLSDEKFTSRAPEHIIAKEKDKLASYKIQMEKLAVE